MSDQYYEMFHRGAVGNQDKEEGEEDASSSSDDSSSSSDSGNEEKETEDGGEGEDGEEGEEGEKKTPAEKKAAKVAAKAEAKKAAKSAAKAAVKAAAQDVDCPSINTASKLNKETRWLETLANIEIANRILYKSRGVSGGRVHALDIDYQNIRCDLQTVPPQSGTAQAIRSALNGTACHPLLEGAEGADEADKESGCGVPLDLMHLYRADRAGSGERFQPFTHLPNRRLLWCGVPRASLGGILSRGFRVPPPDAPLSGYPFGKGKKEGREGGRTRGKEGREEEDGHKCTNW